ncbi:MAG: TVP38/TMEM64 family protein [Legionellaceae bacterium]
MSREFHPYYCMMRWFRFSSILIALVFFSWALHAHMPMLIQWVQQLGVAAWIGFFILYCIAILLFLPIEPLVLASGALFGFYYGFLITLWSAVASASMAFMISRKVGLAWFPYGKNRLNQGLARLESLGWKSLAVSRLTPFLPCSLVNYGYGLTKINPFVYTITNLIFFIPYKLIVAYVGSYV